MIDTIDPGPGFRAELNKAIDDLAPQIIGLGALSSAGLSDELTKQIDQALAGREMRRGLIMDVIHALDVVLEKWGLLKAHGYPDLPHLTISDEVATELQKEKAALTAAIAIFEAQLRASKIQVSLGEATPKIQGNTI